MRREGLGPKLARAAALTGEGPRPARATIANQRFAAARAKADRAQETVKEAEEQAAKIIDQAKEEVAVLLDPLVRLRHVAAESRLCESRAHNPTASERVEVVPSLNTRITSWLVQFLDRVAHLWQDNDRDSIPKRLGLMVASHRYFSALCGNRVKSDVSLNGYRVDNSSSEDQYMYAVALSASEDLKDRYEMTELLVLNKKQ